MIRSTPWAWILAAAAGFQCYREYKDGVDGQRVKVWFAVYCVIVAARMGIWPAWALRPGLRANLPTMAPPIRATNQLMAFSFGVLCVLLQSDGPAQAEAILHITMVTVSPRLERSGFTMGRAATVCVVPGTLGPLVLRDIWFGGSYDAAMRPRSCRSSASTRCSAPGSCPQRFTRSAQRRRNAELVIALMRRKRAQQLGPANSRRGRGRAHAFFASANHDLRQPLNAMKKKKKALLGADRAHRQHRAP